MIYLILLSYIIFSVYWFVTHLGDKNKPAPWYDWIFLAPTFILVTLYALCQKLLKSLN
jgi:hypothetical protein